MDTVWKFRLDSINEQELRIPRGYTPLCIMIQDEQPQLWCRVDAASPEIPVKVFTHGTGHAITDPSVSYVGSYQLCNGALVLHVFIAKGE